MDPSEEVEEDVEEELTVQLVRPPGKSLGFKIVGGTKSVSQGGLIKVKIACLMYVYEFLDVSGFNVYLSDSDNLHFILAEYPSFEPSPMFP